MLTVLSTWVFGSDLMALAFNEAELSMLFPAPLSRRQLILYKLYRAQTGILINALIWVFLLKRGGSVIPAPLRALSFWVLFSTLNLHRLGAALVRSSWTAHGKAGIRRSEGSLAFFVAVVGLLVAALVMNRDVLTQASDAEGFLRALAYALGSTPAVVALYPVRLALAPAFAQTIGEWARTIWPALLLLLAHFVWILRTDASFEDAAIEASAARAKRVEAARARRSVAQVAAPRAATGSFQLASKGNPAGAIFWKNMLCLRRTGQWRLFIGPAAIAISLGAALSGGISDIAAVVSATATILAVTLFVFGGRLIRNDLRHDMLNLAMIKTLPMSTAEIVLAEVASSSLPMAAVQLGLIVIAFVASLFAGESLVGLQMRVGIVIAAPFAIIALNGALMTIQNGIAVLFPAWLRLGATVSSGVEALGQNVLSTAANLLSLAIALIVPAGIGWAAVEFLHEPRALTIALLAIVASVVLAGETYGVMVLLGRALEKAEPGQTG
jgi:hypothetical protein